MGIRRDVLTAALALVLVPMLAAADCAPDRIDLRDDGRVARFGVEVASTPEEQAQGLMFRTSLPASRGMVFTYDPPRETAFWMRNTLIELDMVFIDASGTVVKVHTAQPRDETAVPSGGPVALVLEVRGGMARALGLGEGAEVRSPLIPQDGAVWPCG